MEMTPLLKKLQLALCPRRVGVFVFSLSNGGLTSGMIVTVIGELMCE